MGAFPFYIHLLTPFLIKSLRRIVKEIKTFSVIFPSFKNQGESVDSIEKKLTPNVLKPSDFKKSPDKKEKESINYKKEFNNIIDRLSEGEVEYNDDRKRIDVLDENSDIVYYWEKDENNKWIKTMDD